MKRVLFIASVMAASLSLSLAQQNLAMVAGPGVAGQMIPFRANVVSPPLHVSPGMIDFQGLRPGQTYVAIADMNSQVNPSNGGETVSFSETTISGDPNTSVLVSFVLPDRLNSYTSPEFIDVGFNSLSACWGTGGVENHFFDPRNPAVMQLDASGEVDLVIGCNLYVPETAGPDEYSGDAVILVQYMGM